MTEKQVETMLAWIDSLDVEQLLELGAYIMCLAVYDDRRSDLREYLKRRHEQRILDKSFPDRVGDRTER
jgi:hypothetical protein